MTDTLLSLAELAVAITGFAAIVIVFRRRESGRWERIGANSFNGMLFHSMTALVFCLLPVTLEASALAPAAIWRVASGLLGGMLLLHAPIVAFVFARGRALASRAVVLAAELPVAAVMLAVASGALAERAAGLFVAAVCLQILQAAGLFFSITFVRRDEMED
jgi:putative effector of murein hydrolase LrgA (UPF0299 family)